LAEALPCGVCLGLRIRNVLDSFCAYSDDAERTCYCRIAAARQSSSSVDPRVPFNIYSFWPELHHEHRGNFVYRQTDASDICPTCNVCCWHPNISRQVFRNGRRSFDLFRDDIGRSAGATCRPRSRRKISAPNRVWARLRLEKGIRMIAKALLTDS
jgi:hypothetical protein